MVEETGIPFNATDFIEGLTAIYKHTHPPDRQKAEVAEVQKG